MDKNQAACAMPVVISSAILKLQKPSLSRNLQLLWQVSATIGLKHLYRKEVTGDLLLF